MATTNDNAAVLYEDVLATIQASVESGVMGVNARDENDNTPLFLASGDGRVDVVRYLVRQGARVNDTCEGWSCLTLASLRGHADIVKLLLEHGADVHLVAETKETALHCASSAEIAKLLLDAGADMDATDTYGRKPHQAAIIFGNFEAAEELLSRGMDLHEQVQGCPLVNIAAANDLGETVQWLIEKEVDLNIVDAHGRTALDQALAIHAYTSSTLLLQNGAVTADGGEGWAKLFAIIAIKNNDTQMLEMLTKRGIDVVGLEMDGSSILHLAVGAGNAEIVTTLLGLGADVNAVDEDGNTPLLLTARSGHPELIKQLVENGADVNVTNANGQTVLHDAVKYGFMDAAIWLVENGADVNAVDSSGNTILHFWVGTSDVEATKTLFDTIVNVNIANEQGRTALHTAAKAGSIPMTEWLVERGADVNAQDEEGLSSLHVAASALRTVMVSWLLEHGANPNAQAKDGPSPVQACVRAMPGGWLVARTYNTLRLLCSHGGVWNPSKSERFRVSADLEHDELAGFEDWSKRLLGCLELWEEQYKAGESSLMEFPQDIVSGTSITVAEYIQSHRKQQDASETPIGAAA